MLNKSIRTELIFFAVLAMLLSCEGRKEGIPVSGQVRSLHEGILLPDVLVELHTRKIESGIYTANYQFFDSVRTDPDGRFSFLLPSESWASVMLYFSKGGYYPLEFEKEGQVLVSEEGLHEIFGLDAVSWIRFHVQNAQPVNAQDRLEIRLMNGVRDCEACCSDAKLVFQGMDYDEEWFCQVAGHQNLLLQWSQNRGASRTGGTRNVFVAAGDTVDIHFE